MIDSLRNILEDLLLSIGLGAASVSTFTLLALICGLALSCWLVGLCCQMVIIPTANRIVKRTNTKFDDIFVNRKFLKAISRTIPAMIFVAMLPECVVAGTHPLPMLYVIVSHLADAFLTLSFVWVITSVLNNAVVYANNNDNLKDYHLEGIIQFVKLLIYFIAAIIIIATIFNKKPLTLFAGLGAAATVMMLIFKDSILGLVASIQISVNKMIKKEDWIIIESKGINGIVEEVNLTTVKVRNFDNSVSMVPPYSLVSESFQNWGCMHEAGKRRVRRCVLVDAHTIHFTDENHTATNLTLYRQHAEEYLHNHPNVVNSEWLMARELEPTEHGLPVQMWFYLNETEFVRFEQIAADIMEYLVAKLPDYSLKVYQYSAAPYE